MHNLVSFATVIVRCSTVVSFREHHASHPDIENTHTQRMYGGIPIENLMKKYSKARSTFTLSPNSDSTVKSSQGRNEMHSFCNTTNFVTFEKFI